MPKRSCKVLPLSKKVKAVDWIRKEKNLYEWEPRQTRIIFWRTGPLYYRLLPLGGCSRNPSVTVLWEAVFSFSEFFWRLFQCNAFAHFLMGDLWMHLPTLCWVFSSFWLKMAWTPCTTLLIHWLAWSNCFVPQMTKVFKGKCFAQVEQVKQKITDAFKGIKINEFKNSFQQWENVLIGELHQMENTLKVNEV